MTKNGKYRITLISLGMLPAVMVLGNSMFIPILPKLESSLQLTTTEASMILTLFSIPAALIIPAVGFLSDRFGRRKLAFLSLWVIIIGTIASSLPAFIPASGLEWLFAGRLLQGIGAGGTATLAMAMVGDRFEGKRRSEGFGVLEVFNGVGKVASPIIGGLVASLYWSVPFFIYGLIALIAVIGLKIYTTKDDRVTVTVTVNEYWNELKTTIQKRTAYLLPMFITGGISLFLLFGMLFYLSYDVETLTITTLMQGIALAFPLLVLTIVSYMSGKKLGEEKDQLILFLVSGSLLIVTSQFFWLLSESFLGLMGSMTVLSGGVGLLLPALSLYITLDVLESERGFVISLYGTARFLGVALGPLIFANWMQQGETIVFKGLFLSLFACGLMIVATKDNLAKIYGKFVKIKN